MSKGGARAVSGPAPDPGAMRRNRAEDQAGWKTLPSDGRHGDPPEWPLIRITARERKLWAQMWAKPQAMMWEELGQQIEVAMFVRKLAEAEQPRASVELQKVIRQYLESLGLSVQGMLRNRWKIAPADEGELEESSSIRASNPPRRSARTRLTVVDGDEGA